MDKKQEYSTIDLHNHSKYSFEVPKATLTVKEILDYYCLIAEIKEKKVAFAITDHNSSEGGFMAWQHINKNPEKYKNIEVIPGIEFGVNCNNVLSYPDSQNNDTKYIFKGMHILAHAKKGKEKEFFKRTWTISMLNRMVIDPATGIYNKQITANSNEEKQQKYVSVGGQILAARNLIANKYGVKIPYDNLKTCIKDGASYTEIRNTFIDICYNHLKDTEKFSNLDIDTALQKISNDIKHKPNTLNQYQPIFSVTPKPVADLYNLNKIDILELNDILGDTATTCFAHPYTLKIHKNTAIPVKNFENVDISMLPQEVQNIIKSKLNNPNEFKNGFFEPEEILTTTKHGCKILGDSADLVAFQMLYNELLKQGVKLDGFEINQFYGTHCLETALDLLVDKYNFKLSFGTDDHFNQEDKYYFQDRKGESKKQSYFSRHEMLAIESAYLKLNRSGKEDVEQEENSFTIHIR